jgi:hypothetical protein
VLNHLGAYWHLIRPEDAVIVNAIRSGKSLRDDGFNSVILS